LLLYIRMHVRRERAASHSRNVQCNPTVAWILQLLSWSMARAVLFCCGGGHAAVVIDALNLPPDNLKVVWDSGARIHPSFASFLHVTTAQDAVLALSAASDGISCYINAGSPTIRAAFLKNVVEAFAGLDIDYPVVKHSTAFVSDSATIGEGSYLGPGAVVHTSAQVGRFCIVNTQASVDHDCVLEDFATVNPHAAICGSVHIGRGCVIGANATVRERTTLAAGITLGMNACATRDLVSAGVYIGTPARKVPQSKQIAGDDHIPHTVQKSTDASHTSAIRWCPKKELNMQRFSKYLQPSLDRGHLTNNGPLQAVLSSKLKQLLDCKSHVIPAASGTAALHALVGAWELQRGKRLRFATQAFTFAPAIQGPLQTAIVLDMDDVSGGPCRVALNRVCDDIDGIIVTNIFGVACDVLWYEQWCQQHNKLLLLDNAATAIGYAADGRCIHDIGNVSALMYW
jgi:UDP-perosamine 4-acetyltransferase